jgi:chlorophyllide a reductase subunit Y
VPTHAEAKDVLAGAMLRYAREEAMAGPVAQPRQARAGLPTISLLGEMFPADPVIIGQMLAPMGLSVGATVPTREWRELYSALDCTAVAAIHPFYTASVREFQAAGRPIVGSAPVGIDGTHDWLGAIGQACGIAADKIALARNQTLAAMRGLLAQARIKGRITLSGYEGSELLVARLLIECGAEVPYVGSACPATPWNAHDAAWLQAKGVQVQFRASLEQDIAAVREFKPQLAIGTTPVVQAAKEACIPSLYFTNLISARPLMGAAGVGSLIQVVSAAIGNQARFDAMKDFFGSVGAGDEAGVWQEQPVMHPEFKADMRRMAEKKRKKAKAEEMGS